MNWSSADDEQRFKNQLAESRIGVQIVHKHLRKRGFQTEFVPERVRTSFDDRDGNGDDADLFVFLKDGSKIGVEVKGRELYFTSSGNLRFPTLFVDRVVKVDRSNVSLYVTINSARDALAVINANTKSQWLKKETFDTVKRHPLLVYECPKHLIKFVKVEQ